MRIPRLHEILEWTGFLLTFIGAAGMAGTMERETTDPKGIVTAAAMLLAGVLSAIWAAYEDSRIRRKKWGTHGWKRQG